uniref:Uncharacterized protein n=1 Tax=Setaria viridis TaxID=4556 RepID=A0A4U6U1X3_SETVI|nr:hypothetical protein SEVIR_6G103300v2 [Setaria viridis]
MLISLAAAKFAFGEIRSRQLPTRTLNHRISIGGLRLGRVTSIQKVQSQPSSADSMTESVTRHRGEFGACGWHLFWSPLGAS